VWPLLFNHSIYYVLLICGKQVAFHISSGENNWHAGSAKNGAPENGNKNGLMESMMLSVESVVERSCVSAV